MIRCSACPGTVCTVSAVGLSVVGLVLSALSPLLVCFECVGCFWAFGWLFLFVVCVCVCSCFCLSVVGVWKYKQGSSIFTLPLRGLYLPTKMVGKCLFFYALSYQKPLFFLTFSLFCQNSRTLSAITYYLSDTCIFQGFTL